MMTQYPRLAMLALSIAFPGIMGSTSLMATTDTERACSGSTPSATTKTQEEIEETKPHRVEITTSKIMTRYQYVESTGGTTLANHQQHKELFKLAVPITRAGGFGVSTTLGSGSGFTGSWDGLGLGNEAKSNFNVRELFLSAKPAGGLELQWGGIAPTRGASTEITTYDNDGYLVGGRLSISHPDQLYFNTISLTAAYLGDVREPNVFRRFDRWDEANYYQFLVVKKTGERVEVSVDYTSQWSISTLRQGLLVKVPEFRLVDSIRFENYQRVEGNTAYGFAVQGEKSLDKRLSLGGGFASIDRLYGGLNADRFNSGKRVFVVSKVPIIAGLSAEFFLGKAVGNRYGVANGLRLDAILTYDLRSGLGK